MEMKWKETLSIEDAVSEFRRQAAPTVMVIARARQLLARAADS